MSEKENLYKILSVNKNADHKEIKQAYKKLAQKYHTDRPTGDKKKFQEIQFAYGILGNAESRERYDKSGATNKVNLRSEAIGIIMKIFMSIIVSVDPQTNNIVELIVTELKKNISTNNELKKKAAKTQTALGSMKERFNKKSEGTNIFITCIEQQAQAVSIDIERFETAIQILEHAKLIMEDYTYSADIARLLSNFDNSSATSTAYVYTGS